MQRVGDIRINWSTVMSYNLLHELICGSLSTEEVLGNHVRGAERRAPEMRCMVEFNCILH